MKKDLAAGIAAGIAGGLIGSWAMNRTQALWSRAAEGFQSPSAAGSEDARDWQERGEGANANELTAQFVAERTVGRPLRRRELAVAAPLVHYAFGATMGAIYGAMAEMAGGGTMGGGAAWGAAVWLGADEIAMPALGLARRDVDYPLEMHAQSLTAHLAYGMSVEAVRRTVRRAFS
jgi:hypothetical protein